MTSTDNTVSELVINKMTQAQYDALVTKSDEELYLVPDTYDTTPTLNGPNPITSGGVYTALSSKADVSSLNNKEDKIVVGTAQSSSFIASVGNYYKVTTTSNITITLNTPSDSTKLSSCIFLIDNTSGGVTFATQDNKDLYSSANWSINTGKIYEVNALYNGTAWYLTQVEMEVAS